MRQQEGLLINEKKIRRFVRIFHLKPRYLHRLRHHSDTRKRIAVKIQHDALRRQFNQAGWVTDITYLIRQQKRTYVSKILDLRNRNIVTFVISHRHDMKLVLDTLYQAHEKKDSNRHILHSDQGFQYTTNEYLKVCSTHGLFVSHTRNTTSPKQLHYEELSLVNQERSSI